MSWLISNCHFGFNSKGSCSLKNNDIELSIDEDIFISPNSDMIYQLLDGCEIQLSDSLYIHTDGMTLILGNLTIYFGDKDPCPVLTWNGSSNSQFNLLNKPFRRFSDLKAFW